MNNPANQPEFVVLVNEQDEEIGIMPKSLVHTAHTPLHRAFSLFLFNTAGQVLVQQRNTQKLTWPGVWSNSCCGHPQPKEKYRDAIKRRVHFELGMAMTHLYSISPYRYTFAHNGIQENEVCPLFVGITDDQPQPNAAEVAAFRWMPWEEFLHDLREHPDQYSPWSIEETQILAKNAKFKRFLKKFILVGAS